jgi:hypothetical protein
MDLPVRQANNVPATRSDHPVTRQTGLSAQNIDTIVNTGAVIAKELMEISRIRTAAKAEVEVIEAHTRALRERVRGEVDRLDAMRQTLGKRGDEAVKIIQAVLPLIPEAERHKAMEDLRKMIDSVIADQGSPTAGQP